MAYIDISIVITADEFLRLYRGEAKTVRARATDGRIVGFPAAALVPFVEHDGVRGRFRIEFDDQNRLKDIRRIPV